MPSFSRKFIAPLKRGAIGAAAAMFVLCTAAQSAETDADELVARNAVRLFFEGCIKIYPDPERFGRWIEQNELPQFPAAAARPFLEDKPGRVWAVDNKDVQYALAAQDDNRCSVFVKRVETTRARLELQPLLDAILKPEVRESKHVEVEQDPAGALTTTTYVYKMADGRWLMTISATTRDHTDGPYQLGLSASTSMRIKSPPPQTSD